MLSGQNGKIKFPATSSKDGKNWECPSIFEKKEPGVQFCTPGSNLLDGFGYPISGSDAPDTGCNGEYFAEGTEH